MYTMYLGKDTCVLYTCDTVYTVYGTGEVSEIHITEQTDTRIREYLRS